MKCFQRPGERLYAVVDVEACERVGRRPREVAHAFFSAGALLVQLRAKTTSSGAFLDLALAIVEDAHVAGAYVIVNDRADLAVASHAAGVHIGQDDLAPESVRRVTGPDLLVGLSTHTAGQVAEAVRQPISYLAIGPVFTTATKATGYEAVGYGAVEQAAAAARANGLPVVAIGGITLETAARVMTAGAAAVAVIGDLLVGDPEVRAREYLSALA
jgi:thiamine-phosphate pyrophosphorylase